MKENMELFHVQAKSFEEAISIMKEKTSKRFLTAMQMNEVEGLYGKNV